MDNEKLFYNSPAKFWTDALPLGNGSLGGMFFCGTNKDRVALNHDTLWTGHPRKIAKDGAYSSYMKAQKLTLDGDYSAAKKELEKNFCTCWSQSYLPLGDLVFNFGMHFAKIENYNRTLDLSTATLKSTYIKNGTGITKEAFISNPDDVLVYKIKSDKKIHFSLSLNCKLKNEQTIEKGILITDGICPSDSDSYSRSYPCNSLIYSQNEGEQGVSFRTAVKIVTNGKVEFKGNLLSVSGSTESIVFLSTKTNFDGALVNPCDSLKEYKQASVNAVNYAAEKGFDKLMAEHIADYKKYYDRVHFTLGSVESEDNLATDKRLLAFKNNKSDMGLYELLYNYGRYLLITSSREGSQVTNLQGIWNENLKAAWNSNYTVNINTEMNYWPVLKSNLAELTKPYDELMKALSVTGEVTAREYYHANGFVVHHNTDIWGSSVATLGDAQWAYWCGGSGWLCHQLFENYEYSLDENYLKDVAFPIIKKCTEFYLDILIKNDDGNYVICPATSPENTFYHDGKPMSVTKSSTILNTIVLDVIENCKKAYEVLGCQDEFYKKICDILPNINPFKIGSRGQLLEWDKEYKEVDVHHRHVSHLIGLHPFSIITKDGTPELFDACKKTLELRGDDGTGWSLAWKINFHARLKDGNKALKLLDLQLNPVKSHKKSNFNFGGGGGTYPNMFDAHPPFQIDGNFGALSGINEMLMQSDGKSIWLLPALPDKWKDGKITGLRAKGNAEVDIEWHNGKVTAYEIHTDNKDNFNIITN